MVELIWDDDDVSDRRAALLTQLQSKKRPEGVTIKETAEGWAVLISVRREDPGLLWFLVLFLLVLGVVGFAGRIPPMQFYLFAAAFLSASAVIMTWGAVSIEFRRHDGYDHYRNRMAGVD